MEPILILDHSPQAIIAVNILAHSFEQVGRQAILLAHIFQLTKLAVAEEINKNRFEILVTELK